MSAASAEMHSVHPLAVAIQKYVKDNDWQTPPHDSSETVVARGMKATVPPFEEFSGGDILVGSRRFMERAYRQLLTKRGVRTFSS